MTPTVTHPRPTATGGRRALRVARRVAPLALVVALAGIALPRMARFSEVWPAIAAMGWPAAALLGAATVWNLVSYAFVLAAATPGLTRSQAMVVTQSSTAVANTVPGGGALGVGVMAGMYRSWGFSASTTSLAALSTGVWNTFAKLGLPVLAVALLAVSGDASWGRLVGAGVGVAVVAAAVVLTARMVRDDRLARRVASACQRIVTGGRRALRRGPVQDWAERASRVRGDAEELVRGCWIRLTVTTVLSQLSACAVLFLALRGVGVSASSVGWTEVLAAFAFVRLLALVPLSPGGVGVVEVGLSAALVSAGAERGPAVAAVLVFRTLTYLAPIVAGVPAYLVWKRRSAWRRPLLTAAVAVA